MKTCEKGLHQYPDDHKKCKECEKSTNAKRRSQATGQIKVCKKGLHQYPDTEITCPECLKNSRMALREKHKPPPQTIKTCKKGLHQYPAECKRCPECAKAGEKHRRSQATGQIKTCKKGLHQYLDTEKQCPDCARESKKLYNQTPKSKQEQKRFREQNKELISALNKAWRTSPAGQAYRKSPEAKAKIKEWKQSPIGKISMSVSSGKRTIIAAGGDLTKEQVLERLEEFNHCCAYCSIKLLTSKDGVNQWHPQYQNIDHIVSLLDKNGTPQGEHTKINVIPACYRCNDSKSNRDVWIWMKETGRIPSEKLLVILRIATGRNGLEAAC